MTDQPLTLTVPPNAQGQRLDQFLASALNRSRADVQRRVRRGEITIAGQVAANDLRLETGWTIVLTPDATSQAPAPVPQPTVLFEDDDLLVLDKPVGLIMHRAPGVRGLTLADWLLAHRASLTTVGEDTLRPGIVHRLDSDASGIVVIAKTQSMYAFLKSAFQEHRVEKHYLALVHGVVERDASTIDFPIERSGHDGLMAARPIGAEGRPAVTHFTVLKRLPPFTLLDVTTETGRTHQVRVHLQAIGHPIAGDTLYHGRERMKREPPRLFLHATRVRLPLPDASQRTFDSALPVDLAGFLSKLQRP